jgi:hypothetical protein
MFRFQKWYLDLVTGDGTVFIGYHARLTWGAVRAKWASTLLSPAGARSLEATSLRGTGIVTRNSQTVSWTCPSLDVTAAWQFIAPPVRQTLLDESRGAIRWECPCTSGEATVKVGDARLRGIGYAERLTLTLRPWQFPFDHLTWGRYATTQNAVTWIAWQGKCSTVGLEKRGSATRGATGRRRSRGTRRGCRPAIRIFSRPPAAPSCGLHYGRSSCGDPAAR